MFTSLPWNEAADTISEARRSGVARARSSNWHTFLSLIRDGLLPGSGVELNGNVSFVKDVPEPAGSTSLAIDAEVQFLAASRTLWSDSRRLSLEVFWCPVDIEAAICGFRLRSLGDSYPVSDVWEANWLKFLTLSDATAERASWEALPSFSQNLATWAAQGHVQLDLQALDAIRADTALLKEDLADQVRISDGLRDELSGVRTTLHEVRTKARNRHYSWERSDADEIGESAPPESQTWDDLSRLEDWRILNEDRIVVMPRALNGAKKSDYVSPDHVRVALEFLAGPYRENRIGKLPKESMLEALERSGMKMAGSAGATTAGSEGDAYFIQWNGRRRFLDWHLGRGGGRETRYCLRIYYTWCDESNRVIVGWLPTHLNNSLS